MRNKVDLSSLLLKMYTSRCGREGVSRSRGVRGGEKSWIFRLAVVWGG
jgi:hypothetical protein